MAFGIVQDVLFHLADALQFFLVFAGEGFQRLVRVADVLEFLVQGPAVAGNLAQVALNPDEFFTRTGFGILDDGFREPHLAGQFKGKGVAREADFQLEQGDDVLGVELHGPVDDACFGPGGIQFQVGVVGGNDPIHPAFVEFCQDGFGDGAAGRGFRSAAEFINQHEGFLVRTVQHLPHIGQEGRIGAEVVFQALVVSDAHHDAVEHRQLRGLGGGDEHAPLEHVLQEPRGFQANGLAAGIGTGDEQEVFLRSQGNRERNNLLALFVQGPLQQGMARLAQVHLAVFRNDGHSGLEVQGGQGLRHQEINFAQIGGGLFQVGHIGPDEFAERIEDAGNLAGLGKMKLADFVLDFNDFRRLYKGGLAGSGGVVHESRQFSLAGRIDGDEQFSVAHGQGGVGIGQPLVDGFLQQGGRPFRQGAFFVADALADGVQLVRGGIFHLSEFVQDGIDAAEHFREGHHLGAEPLEIRVDSVFDAAEKVDQAADGVQQGLEFSQRKQVDAAAVLFQRNQEGEGVDVTRGGEVLFEHSDETHFIGKEQPFADVGGLGGEGLFGDSLQGIIGAAPVRKQRPDLVESQFLFQPSVDCHVRFSVIQPVRSPRLFRPMTCSTTT